MQFETPKEWLDVSKRFSAQRELVGTLEVIIGTDLTVLDRFVGDVHSKMDSIWADTHVGTEFPVTPLELRRYFITGLKSRVQHVRMDRTDIRTNDRWYMPAPFATVIARLGRVDLEVPVVRILPVWNLGLDSEVLSFDEWLVVSQKLARVEADRDAQILFAHALEKSRDGDPQLMGLLPRRAIDGTLIELRSYRELDLIAATAYLIFGMSPVGWDEVILPSHPFLQPAFYQPVSLVSTMLTAMTEVRGGKSA